MVSKAFVVYMTALVNALKMTYVSLGYVKGGVCKPNDSLIIILLLSSAANNMSGVLLTNADPVVVHKLLCLPACLLHEKSML